MDENKIENTDKKESVKNNINRLKTDKETKTNNNHQNILNDKQPIQRDAQPNNLSPKFFTKDGDNIRKMDTMFLPFKEEIEENNSNEQEDK